MYLTGVFSAKMQMKKVSVTLREGERNWEEKSSLLSLKKEI